MTKPNFTGTWKFNSGKSILQIVARPLARTVTLTQVAGSGQKADGKSFSYEYTATRVSAD